MSESNVTYIQVGTQGPPGAPSSVPGPPGPPGSLNYSTNKSPVNFATWTALPANTYSNGSSGVGATLTGSANGALTVDGVVVATGERILVAGEYNQANNGIYIVTQAGSSSSAYILTRSTDANTPVLLGLACMQVLSGTQFSGWGFLVVQGSGSITIGTTAITVVGQPLSISLIGSEIASLNSEVGPVIALVQTPAGWMPTFLITDPSGYRLLEVSANIINHPDTNAMRGKLVAFPSGYPTSWQGGLDITDAAGYLLAQITPSKVNHPDINTIRSQVAANTAAIAAIGGGGTTRIANGFAFLGDSRIAQMYTSTPSAMGSIKVRHQFFNKANYQMGQAMTVMTNLATSGYRSDQYLTQANLNTAMATIAKNLFIYGIFNDVIQGYTAAEIWNGYNGSPGILSAVNQATAQGMRVILGMEAGGTALNSAEIAQINIYRQMCYELREKTPNVELLDIAAPLWGGSVSTAAISFLPGVLQVGDPTHPGTLGGALVAPDMVELAKRINITPIQRKIIAPWETAGNGQMQWLQNPLFTTTSGGGAGAGVTGNVPANWNAGVTGTGLITAISYSATATGQGSLFEGGCGNDMTLNVTFGAAGDTVYLNQAINLAGVSGQYPAPAAGQIFQLGVEVAVAAGSVNFAGAILDSGGPAFNDSTFMQFKDGWVSNTIGAGPTFAYTDTLETDKFTIPSGKTLVGWSPQITLWAAGAGSATVTIRQAQLRQRLS